jgi:prophage regulatory protein
MSIKMLRMKQVLELTGLSRPGLYKLMLKRRFPRPIKIAARAVAWPEDEVIAWKKAMVAERDARYGVQSA